MPLPLAPFTFSHYVSSTLLLCHTGTSVYLPPSDYWCISSFWQVQVPHPKWQFQRFRVAHWAKKIRGHPYPGISYVNRLYTLKCSYPLSHYFLALVIPFFLSFILLLSRTPQASLLDSISSWLPPVSLHTFLDYAIPRYSSSLLRCVLPHSPISYAWQPLFWHAPYFLVVSTFSRVLLVLSGYIPSCALAISISSVLLVALEHPTRRTFLAAVDMYCFQLFYQLCVPFPYFSCIF